MRRSIGCRIGMIEKIASESFIDTKLGVPYTISTGGEATKICIFVLEQRISKYRLNV